MNAKNLHKHAIPVVLVGLASFLAVAVLVTSLRANLRSQGAFATALTSPVVKLKPTSGLTTQVELKPNTQANASTSDELDALASAAKLHFALSISE